MHLMSFCTGGSIPLSLADRLAGGITFVVGNTRAFAAVSQSGRQCEESFLHWLHRGNEVCA